ncbi:MAG: excinuclease ABC subunit C, partial [Cyclobacteriaceae bacterium]|nr:excinuclease ABC subunit C [Cyclobacteriaceae bacterium]
MSTLQKLVKSVPNTPGVYKFFNSGSTLIYVGKAKDLKKRVSSYFNKSAQHSRKTKKLVSEIENIEFIVTNSEFDALLLENNLIKTNQPKYNILLKDDKTFPYLCLTNQRFPRIYSTRKLDKSKGEYFGPYTSAVNMRAVLDLVNRLYSLRTCKFDLSEANIKNKKFKVCLEYHIGNCKGPCEGLQSEKDYSANLQQAVNILKGDLTSPKRFLEDQMKQYASHLEFEQAEEVKHKLDQLNTFYNKSVVVNPKLNSLYVIAITSNERKAFVNFMQVKNGSIFQSKSLEIKKQLEEKDTDLIISSIARLVNDWESNSEITVLSNLEVSDAPQPIHIEVPKIGDKRKLVDMALKNALFLKKNSEQKSEEPTYSDKVLLQLQQALSL